MRFRWQRLITRLATSQASPRRPSWKRETGIIAAFYFIYQIVRSNLADPKEISAAAIRHAQWVISFEKSLHIYTERAIQSAFLDARWFIKILNVYYGTLHFIVTIGVLVWLFFKHQDKYRLWRNTLGVTTAMALIGFATYPLQPPRMIAGFHDTLEEVGGLWSFQSPTAKALANQYAAMPSLHFGWSLWCGLALFFVSRNKWVRTIAFIYPLVTVFDIIVTANHFWLDALAGAALVGIASAVVRGMNRILATALRSSPSTVGVLAHTDSQLDLTSTTNS